MRDGVAERTKASVATRVIAGLNPDHGQHLSSDTHSVWRKRGCYSPLGHSRNLWA